MHNRIKIARSQNNGRQPVKGINHCTGRVDDNMPSEPVISIQELARTKVGPSNQRRKPVSGAIKQALTPIPTSTRAASSQAKLLAIEKAKHPMTAKLKK